MSKKDLISSIEATKVRLSMLRQYIQVLEKSDGKKSEDAMLGDAEPVPAITRTTAQKKKKPSPTSGRTRAQPATATSKKKPVKPAAKPKTTAQPDMAPAKPKKKPAKPKTTAQPDMAPAKPKKKPDTRTGKAQPAAPAKPKISPAKPAAKLKTTPPADSKKLPPKAADKKTQKPKTTRTSRKKTAPKPAEPPRPNTLEDELAEQLTPEEIDSFQIEKVDMERLTHKVCDLLVRCESEGMLQADLYKKLKLSARNGARLSLKLERMGMVTRIKLLEKQRWTYKLILKKTPVSTASLEDAPCLVCPVEQRCSLDGEISPRTCVYIEDWVMAELKRTKAK